MTTTLLPAEQQFLLDDADWEYYEATLEQVGDRHVFVTYDRGRLELMSPSREHDKAGILIAKIISATAEILDLPLDSGGSTTYRRQDLKRGLEPDQCFYIANEQRVRGKRKLQLPKDPPPDLVLEVEISHRLLERISIYAALGVPELWRYDGRNLRVQVLRGDAYQDAAQSLAFPRLPLHLVHELVQLGFDSDETSWIKVVRKTLAESLH